MAMTIVGLFDDPNDSKAALRDLADAGFGISDTQTISGKADKVRHTLADRGVPDADIRMYEHGVQSGDSLIALHASDDRAEAARDIMNRHNAIDIHHAGQVRGMSTSTTSAGMTTATATHTATTSHAAHAAPASRNVAAGESVTVPIVEEHLAVGKRQIERGGARIHTHVIEKPVTETVTLREEEVVVDRHAVNRPVSRADLQNAFQETTIQVTERDEVPVVAKEARVVEEVTIGKQQTQRTETITDTVRRTDVDVEELNEGDATVMGTTTRGTTVGRR
jgi:uncharacterized protein (TIGR02271 family)